jgi:hypothetical protein
MVALAAEIILFDRVAVIALHAAVAAIMGIFLALRKCAVNKPLASY